MKHTLCIKWLAVGLAALSFGRPADAATNDPNAAYKINLERAISLINTGKTSWASDLSTEAVLCINALEKSGDRSLLPYLAEKSLNAANPKTVRRRAAAAYVNMADMEETVAFMKKMNAAPSVKGTSWLYFLNRQILGKFAAQEKHMNADTKEKFFSCLLDIIQSSNDSEEAEMANRFLLDRIPEYANSRQRATLCRFANTGNAWVTNTYNPIKAHFDVIPPKQRTDLRKRFPDLPPLPGDAPARSSMKVALAIIAGVVALAVCAVAAWLAVRRRRVRKAV
jgi:hypothetical protein